MGDTTSPQGFSMENKWRMMQQLQEDNNNFKNAFEQLQLTSSSIVFSIALKVFYNSLWQ